MDLIYDNLPLALTAAATAAAVFCAQVEYLDEGTTSIPVVGHNIVVGSKARQSTKILKRPPHKLPPASWHLNPDLGRKGPLTKAQVETFFEDGYLFLPEFYKADCLAAVQQDVDSMINNLAIRLFRAGKRLYRTAQVNYVSPFICIVLLR
jgi:hypothetical protein